MFFCQFCEKRVSVRERNVRLLLETVTYIATTEAVTCIITMEIVMCTAENNVEKNAELSKMWGKTKKVVH